MGRLKSILLFTICTLIVSIILVGCVGKKDGEIEDTGQSKAPVANNADSNAKADLTDTEELVTEPLYGYDKELYDRFVKAGSDFVDNAKELRLIRIMPEFIEDVYFYQYMINGDHMDKATVDELVKDGIIDMANPVERLEGFLYTFRGSLDLEKFDNECFDLTMLCLYEEEIKNSEVFMKALNSYVSYKLEDYINNTFDFVNAGYNYQITDFPQTFDEMSNGSKVIYLTCMDMYRDVVRWYRELSDPIDDLRESIGYEYLENYAQAITDNSTAITMAAKLLWKGGKDYIIKIRNLPPDASITYISSNTDVAKVDENGLVSPVSIGKADITATIKQDSKTVESTIAIEVKEPSVLITSHVSGMNLEETCTLNVKNGLMEASYEWASSDPSIIELDKLTGEATAKATGTTTLNVLDTISGGVDSIDVSVYRSDVSIERFYGTYAERCEIDMVGNEYFEWRIKVDDDGVTFADNSKSDVWSKKDNVHKLDSNEGVDGGSKVIFSLNKDNTTYQLYFAHNSSMTIESYEGNYSLSYYKLTDEEFEGVNAELKKSWVEYDEKLLKYHGTWYLREETYSYMIIQYHTGGDGGFRGYNSISTDDFSSRFDTKLVQEGSKEYLYIYLEGESKWKYKLRLVTGDEEGEFYLPKLIGVDSGGNDISFGLGFG
ncbi:MAG: Ig-like domain-containing protein [Clostridiales bacterium]|jgi:hypothetical protein|nr:Ig-like domain-containing protein [Clostridiales bacterium]